MTRNRSSRNRRRNREQADIPDEQQTNVAQSTGEVVQASSEDIASVQAQPQVGEQRRRRRPERTGPPAQQRPTQAQESHPRPPGDGSQDRRPRTGPPPPNRRPRPAESRDAVDDHSRQGGQRPNRRRPGRQQPPPVPVVGDVFKRGVRVTGGRNEATSTRPEFAVNEEGAPVLGCPMLTRTRLGIPFAGGRHTPRCALGWAIHSEREAGYCMETPQVHLCWKQNPERLAEFLASGDDRAAD